MDGSEDRVDDRLGAVVRHQLRMVQQLRAIAEDLGPYIGFGVEDGKPFVIRLRSDGR